MGEHDERGSGLLPNGLVPNEAGSVMRVVGDGDSDRWLKAEKRTAQLIACIQPNSPSEHRRNAVAHYVQRLIRRCFPCEVFTFGSVPLKTYLPDGDIDLTAFSKNQNMKESWAHQVRDMLENEEKNENAEFHVKEVQYIQAEVKIIKCLVENIVVDISFNQLGGLCTLCFLEEVDNLINQNHLFKRSIILIKAWCYYESRILGAHHGLISTYALETLVLYIFHVFNNSFAGPLEVLYRFLEFFSKFDWDNFCVSLWGPVPISSLPDVTAESPRKDGGELLLSKSFLDACSTAYAVHPGGQENQGQPFVSKHFNVIDPLRINNNLGRSVSKGNFFRIRSAFAFGAKRLARLLDCPKEELVFEVNQFFLNTWDRHGRGHRPDAPRNDLWHLRLSAPDQIHVSESLRSNSSSQRNDIFSGHETQVGGTRGSGSVSSQHANHSLESSSRTSDVSTVSRTQSQKSYGNPNNSGVSDQIRWEISSNQGALVDKVQRISKPDNLVNDIQGKFLFARTRSSPELTDTYGEVSSQGRRNRGLESGKSQTSARFDNSRRKNQESDILASHSIRTEDPASVRHISSRQSLDAAADSNCGSNSYHEETGSGAMGEEFASVMGAQGMHQEEQDLVNMMASSATHNFNGQVHLPLNLASGHFPIPSSVLASMEHAQRNLSGMVPTNFPLFETPWGINMQFPQGFSSPLAHYFPGMGLTSNPEDSVEQPVNENFGSVEMSLGESDNDFWHEQDRGSTGGFDLDNGSFEMLQSDDKLQSTSASHKFDPSFHTVGSSSSTRNQQKITKENQGSMRDDHVDALQYQDNRGNEVYHDDRTSSSRSLPSATPSSVKSKTSSESSFEGSSVKVSKSTREKRGRRTAASVLPSTIVVKGKSTSEHSSTQGDDDNRDWNLPSTMGSELAERSTGAQSVAALHVTRHQVPGFESAQTSGSEPLIPIAPMLLGPGSRQRNPDGSSVPTYFYPTGPPVPFVAFPMYNFPTEAGTSDTSMSQFSGEEGLDNSDSSQNFDSSEGLDLREVLSTNSVRSTVPIEPLEHKSDILNSDFASHWQNLLYGRFTNSVRSTVPIEPLEHKSDILNSDFASHWQNLLYGRFCQNSRYPAPLIYPSPVMVPPVYLHGRFPSDGPGRPLSNANLFTQLMSYGPRFVPVAPLQSVSNRPAAVFPRYGDEIPRYRSGTGTYLPNPKLSARDRQSTGARRGNYNYDRSDHHGDREGNWNINSKSRAAGRSHSRTQAEKPNSRSDRLAASESRNDRPWGSHRRDSFPSHQSQNGPVRSNSAQSSPSNVTYGMCPLPTMNPSGVASNGPPLVMLYPYDHNAGGYGSHAEQLEFGSLGPVGLSGVNEVSQLNDGSQLSGAFEIHGVSAQRSSPDQPSSPHLRRSVTQRNYLLKEEDFPTLAFPNQGGNDSERSYDEKPSHFQTRDAMIEEEFD